MRGIETLMREGSELPRHEEPKPVTVTIDGCLMCPFFHMSECSEGGCESCTERLCTFPNFDPFPEIKARDTDRTRRQPSWCPLKKQPVLVKLGDRHG